MDKNTQRLLDSVDQLLQTVDWLTGYYENGPIEWEELDELVKVVSADAERVKKSVKQQKVKLPMKGRLAECRKRLNALKKGYKTA